MRNIRMVTTFYQNREYYEGAFIEWYSKHFECNEFMFFIGEDEFTNATHNIYGQPYRIEEETVDGVTLRRLFYPWGKSRVGDAQRAWHGQKQRMWRIMREGFPEKPSLICDCDEFIYTKNLDRCLAEGRMPTHFYEHVPTEDGTFSLDDTHTWCEQGWYYGEQFKARERGEECRINHNHCKEFYFGRVPHTSDFLHMGPANSYCDDQKSYQDYENICFHVSVVNYEHFKGTKQWSHLGEGQTEMDIDQLNKEIFTRDYLTVDKNYATFPLRLNDLLGRKSG